MSTLLAAELAAAYDLGGDGHGCHNGSLDLLPRAIKSPATRSHMEIDVRGAPRQRTQSHHEAAYATCDRHPQKILVQ